MKRAVIAAFAALVPFSAMADQTPNDLGWDSNSNIINASKSAAEVFYTLGADVARNRVQTCYKQVAPALTMEYERCMAMDGATILAEMIEVQSGHMAPDSYFTLQAFRARNTLAFTKWGGNGDNKFRDEYLHRLTESIKVGTLMYAKSDE
jgi:hypothetical protein